MSSWKGRTTLGVTPQRWEQHRAATLQLPPELVEWGLWVDTAAMSNAWGAFALTSARLESLAAQLLYPLSPSQPPNFVVFSFPALSCTPRAPQRSPWDPEHHEDAPPGHPISDSPGGLSAGSRAALGRVKKVAGKDEAKYDDINRIRQTLEVFCPFYSFSSPGLIPRGNTGAILPL